MSQTLMIKSKWDVFCVQTDFVCFIVLLQCFNTGNENEQSRQQSHNSYMLCDPATLSLFCGWDNVVLLNIAALYMFTETHPTI